jgi:sugar lactone lactonase YvrE
MLRRELLFLSLTFGLALPASPARAQVEVFVTDTTRIVRIDPSGAQSTFASGLTFATALTFDTAGNLFVADTQAGVVRKYSPTGQSLGVFVSPGANNTYDLTFDAAGNLYVSDAGSNRIRKYSPSGQLLADFFAAGNTPTGVVTDAGGNALVALLNSNQIRKFSPSGQDLGVFSSAVTSPFRLAFDAAGNVYVSQQPPGSGSVRKLSSTGADLGTFTSGGLNSADGLAFDPAGFLYVGDNVANTIRRYSPTGQDLGVFASGLGTPLGLVVRPVPEPGSLALAGAAAALGAVG